MNILYRLQDWIDDHIPVRCGGCGKWLWAKDARHLETQWGKIVTACQECYEIEMHPYGKGKP